MPKASIALQQALQKRQKWNHGCIERHSVEKRRPGQHHSFLQLLQEVVAHDTSANIDSDVLHLVKRRIVASDVNCCPFINFIDFNDVACIVLLQRSTGGACLGPHWAPHVTLLECTANMEQQGPICKNKQLLISLIKPIGVCVDLHPFRDDRWKNGNEMTAISWERKS